jgi:N-acetylmuramoyl-L-alanine amidase/type II secretory pathway predicted ATPase ExeA
MFLDFYGLHEQPFGVTPDPAYLYPSQTHCEALDALTEGILGGRGFLALIAEPGMGKTTLLYQVLDRLRDKGRGVFLFQTQCDSREFFQYLLNELGVDSKGMGLVSMHTKLNEMLFAELWAGRRFVLIVDEAQNLDDTVLETIRLLSNFETSNTKLLQIVLAGQPHLAEKLRQKQLAQLLQRITVVKHLNPLSAEETSGYIRHRLKVAGHSGEGLFEPEAMALIAKRSQGIPRNINRICFNALMEGHAEGRPTVSADIVERADRKLDLGAGAPPAPVPTQASSSSSDTVGVSVTPNLTYKLRTGLGSLRRQLWMGVLIVALLSAGLAFPRNMSKDMVQTLWSQLGSSPYFVRNAGVAAVGDGKARFAGLLKRLMQREEEVDGRLQAQGRVDVAKGEQAIETRPGEQGIPSITDIRVLSKEKDAQVVVMLDNAVRYNSARVGSPERIYFDLYKARLNPSVRQKTVSLQNGLLQWVRAAQNTDDVVRLVLDAEGAKDYSAQLLSDPYRLVIDVRAQPTGSVKSAASSSAEQGSGANAPVQANATHESRPSLTRELGLKINRIAIDPGHGGNDTGATGPHGVVEKSLCLDIAQRLGRLIQENIAGAEVIYTRKDDTYVSLEERTAIANSTKADLFISIHANSSDSREVRGVETYYLSLATSPESMKLATRENAAGQSSLHDLPKLIQTIASNEKTSESKQLAVDIQNALSRRLEVVSPREKNRGVKQAPFIVLTGANMPAVLSEISFLSNASDESQLLESSQRQRVAEGLYLGVAAYLDGLNDLPNHKEKVVSENRPGASSGSVAFTTTVWRDPLKLLTGGN